MTNFERIGGEHQLRKIISQFVDLCFDDLMIGFFFRNADKARIQEMEYQHAAQFLGADLEYAGRELSKAHRPHRIMGGQFARRLVLLKEVLDENQVDEEIKAVWLAHQQSLRRQITGDSTNECIGR